MEDSLEKSSSTSSHSESSNDSYEASPTLLQPREESLTGVSSVDFVSGSIPTSLSFKSGHIKETNDEEYGDIDDEPVLIDLPQDEPVLPKRPVYELDDAPAVERPADVLSSDEAENNSGTLPAEPAEQDSQQAGGATLELATAEEGPSRDGQQAGGATLELATAEEGPSKDSQQAGGATLGLATAEEVPSEAEEEEEVKSKPKDTNGSAQDEPALGAAAMEVKAQTRDTRTKELRFEVPFQCFVLSTRKTWSHSCKRFPSSDCTMRMNLRIDPDITRDNNHRTELVVVLTLANKTSGLFYDITVKARLLDSTRGSDCQVCKDTCRFNAEKESGNTCLGHDEQTCSVKDDHEPIAVKLHLAPQDAIKECTGARKLILLVSVTVESGLKVVHSEDGDWLVYTAEDNT